MKELEIAKELIKQVIYGDKTFKKALRTRFINTKDNENDVRSTVSILMGCELRHHYFLEYLTKDIELTCDQRCLVYIALANNLFVRRLESNAVDAYVNKQINSEKVMDLLTSYGDIDSLIDESISRESIEYYSLRFNTPVWLIKMWQKHYGVGNTFKILRTNLKSAPNTFKSLIDVNDVVSNNSHFSYDEKANILRYDLKLPQNKMKFFEENDVVPVKTPIGLIFDKIKNNNYFNILCYLGQDNEPFFASYLNFKDSTFNLSVDDYKDKNELNSFIKKNNISKSQVFMAGDDVTLEVKVTTPQDLVVVYPKSTAFEQIRRYPDYFVKFDRESMDELIINQKKALNDNSKILSNGGTLIYMLNTMNKKESHNVIVEFLQTHKDFTLKEEVQILPASENSVCFYYAILEKGTKVVNND